MEKKQRKIQIQDSLNFPPDAVQRFCLLFHVSVPFCNSKIKHCRFLECRQWAVGDKGQQVHHSG